MQQATSYCCSCCFLCPPVQPVRLLQLLLLLGRSSSRRWDGHNHPKPPGSLAGTRDSYITTSAAPSSPSASPAPSRLNHDEEQWFNATPQAVTSPPTTRRKATQRNASLKDSSSPPSASAPAAIMDAQQRISTFSVLSHPPRYICRPPSPILISFVRHIALPCVG